MGENFELVGTAHLNGLHSGMVASTSLFGSLIEEVSKNAADDPMRKIDTLEIRRVRIEKI